jgi:hypothetical protein
MKVLDRRKIPQAHVLRSAAAVKLAREIDPVGSMNMERLRVSRALKDRSRWQTAKSVEDHIKADTSEIITSCLEDFCTDDKAGAWDLLSESFVPNLAYHSLLSWSPVTYLKIDERPCEWMGSNVGQKLIVKTARGELLVRSDTWLVWLPKEG